MTIYLYVKTHLQTGKKYLGKTEQDPYIYKGSGKLWKLHVNKHGDDVWTNVIYQSDSQDDIRKHGIYYSELWNIVDSKEWLNMRPEIGDGGNTVSNKKWITDGVNDKYQDIDIPIPKGWSYGRSKCIWKPTTIRSEEARRKSSEAQMGEKHHLWGKTRSNETKEKIRQSHLGKKRESFSDEWKRNLSASRLGKKRGSYKKEKSSRGWNI